MLWVGGGILLHGSHELGLHAPAELAHGVQHAIEEEQRLRIQRIVAASVGEIMSAAN